MEPTFDVTGFKELEKSLLELEKISGKTTGGKASLRRSLTKAMQPLEQRAKDLAPKDTGDLADSITTKKTKAVRISRTEFAKASGVEVSTGPTGKQEGGVGAWKEFGTVKEAADPFMRPAMDSEAHKVLANVRDLTKADLDKAIARAKRKAAKG